LHTGPIAEPSTAEYAKGRFLRHRRTRSAPSSPRAGRIRIRRRERIADKQNVWKHRHATSTVRYNWFRKSVSTLQSERATMDDESVLIDGLRQRDPQAFATFFERYADRMYRLAYGVVGSEADAEEVAQATFISALEAIDRFEQNARLSTWLYRIAYNHALMILRRRRPEESLPDDDNALPMPSSLTDWSTLPEDRLLSREAQEILRKAIAELPTTLRAAFICRDIEGLSTAECAQIIGVSEGALKVRLHRARLTLRERVSAYFGEWMAS